MSFISATLLLFLVMDPFGNIPFFLVPMRHVVPERRRIVLARELLIALGILVFFLFCGPYVMKLLAIDDSSIGIVGGVVLFMISIKMVFGGSEQLFAYSGDREPFIVPLATPYVAGPSAIAVVLLLMGQDPSRWPEWLAAVIVAWLGLSVILMASDGLHAFFKERALVAIERLTGFILATIAVDMLLKGVGTFLKEVGKG
ncbi:MAG TPA: MarC family protein [Thermoguttaceae bacterium]|nr:MarC family protein [Thermoguttaceae bacterium]